MLKFLEYQKLSGSILDSNFDGIEGIPSLKDEDLPEPEWTDEKEVEIHERSK